MNVPIDKKTVHSQLLEHFSMLEKDQRMILHFLSIHYATINRPTLASCLRGADMKGEKGKFLLAKELGLLMLPMIDQNLVVVDSFNDKKFSCNPLIAGDVTQSSIVDGCFKPMVQVVQRTDPAIRPSFYSFRPNRGGDKLYDVPLCLREIRIGLYAHDVESVEKYRQLGREQFPDDRTLKYAFSNLCFNPFDRTWFATLPLSIQASALEEWVPQLLEVFQNGSDLLPLLHAYQHFPESNHGPRFRKLLVWLLILSGDLVAAQKILQGEERVKDDLELYGWLFFLQGRNEAAIETYELALKQLRKESGRKKIYFSQISGLFYLLALFKSGNPLLRGKVSGYLEIISTQKSIADIPAYLYIESLIKAQKNLVAGALHQLNLVIPLSTPIKQMEINSTGLYEGSEGRFTHFFKMLVRFWVDLDSARKNRSGLDRLFLEAKEQGILWVSMELAMLLGHLDPENKFSYDVYCDQVKKSTGMVSVLPIFPREEKWQKALTALKQLTHGAHNEKKKVGSAERRLIWLISLEAYEVTTIQPKEQVLGKTGRWSKGRLVGLKRLKEEGSSLDYLTDQDRKICGSIVRESEYYYHKYTYRFDWQRAIPLMVGHPLVFWQDNPTVAVELVQAEPELMVKKKGSNVSIQFSEGFGESGVRVTQDSPTRCSVVEVTQAHWEIAAILGKKGLTVPLANKEQVLEVMHSVSSMVTIQSEIGGGSEDRESVVADTLPHVHLLPYGDGLKAKIQVRPFSKSGPYFMPGKGGKTIISEVDGKRLQAHRNLPEERNRALSILSSCPSLGADDGIVEEWAFEEPESCLELLLELQSCGDLMQLQWPEGEKFRVTSQVSMDKMRVGIQQDGDWFSLKGSVELDESLIVEMEKLLEFVNNSQSRFVPLEDGKFLALTERFRRRLLEINAFSEKSAEGRRFHSLAAPILEEISQGAKSSKSDKAWKSHLKQMQTAMELESEIPSTLQAQLRSYQVEGFQWLNRLAAWGVGACLADDMGLGKTLQALAVMVGRASLGPTLVVAPTSVCFNWLSEMKRFTPTLNGLFFSGNQREQMIGELKPFDVLVCSYGLLQQESDLLNGCRWNAIVLDEAQAIKNRATKRSQAAMSLTGSFKMIMTGTPIENHLGELWNLFRFINPGLLGSMEKFNNRFANPIERYGEREASSRLKKLIQPFVLRRKKSQVLEELPSRTEIVLQVEMSKEEMAFYETLRRQAIQTIDGLDGPVEQNQLQILAQIMMLRRACCNSRLVVPDSPIPSSKLELFWDVVAELIDNRHKVLVFSQFVGHLSLIRQWLDDKQVSYQYLDGSTPIKERKRRVDAFQSGEGDLFLISLKAGGLGINLTAADYVIHMDPWWNPAVEDQASDRAHRIGQKRPVTIYRLVSKGTIEEKIVELHKHKRDLADGLLEGSDKSGKLSAKELLNIIRG